MATPQDIAHALLHASEQIARKVTNEPTGVTPGYHAALGATVREDGRLRHVSAGAFPGVALLCRGYSTGAQAIPSGVRTRLDIDYMDYDPQSLITTGAAWKFTAPALAFYLVLAHGEMESKTWASTKELSAISFDQTGLSDSILSRDFPIGTAIAAFWGGWGFHYLSAGDEVGIDLYHTFGSSVNADSFSELVIMRVG